MSNIQLPENPRHFFPFSGALVITLVMGAGITVLDVLQPAEPVLSILAFIPGIISIAALSASGLSRTELYLRPAKVSLFGLAVLGAVTLLLLPILVFD
jgi:membrane-bound ClpP family serine protease